MAPPNLPIGTSDFRQLRERGRIYVDKTAFVAAVLSDPADVLLLPRPRRFGKTTNLSTLRYFVEQSGEDLSRLFEGLAVWDDPAARAHFQRYPVIFVTFKDVKTTTFEGCVGDVARVIGRVYEEHALLLTSDRLSERDRAALRVLAEGRAELAQLRGALQLLCECLARHHGREVVVLIDEYDTPLHAAFAHGYFDEALELFRPLLAGVLKDNRQLFKAVLTGILRVAKESLFSDLNNISTFSLLHPRFAPYFGFTEAEVAWLVDRVGRFPGSLDELRAWYNGYVFGGEVIYNPWSVLAALDRGKCDCYWVNTSSNELVRELLLRATEEQHAEIEALLAGGSIRKALSEHTVLREVYADTDALWSFLLFCGYLRASEVELEEDGSTTAALAIPNRELRTVFSTLFRNWLKNRLGGSLQLEQFGRALLAGDVASCETYLSRALVESTSSFDLTPRAKMPPEQLYHVFVLGLLVWLRPRYQVRSNRESGYGRADVLIVPREPGEPGVVLELKVQGKRQTLEEALKEGLRQLAEQDYAAELRAAGATPIHELAVAFDGKEVLVAARPPGGARKKRSAKKASVKKTGAKKTGAKKTGAKKAGAKKKASAKTTSAKKTSARRGR